MFPTWRSLARRGATPVDALGWWQHLHRPQASTLATLATTTTAAAAAAAAATTDTERWHVVSVHPECVRRKLLQRRYENRLCERLRPCLTRESRPDGGIGARAWCTQNSDELLCRDRTDPTIVKVLMAIDQEELAVMLREGVPSDNDSSREWRTSSPNL
eukprot:SAG31_NODE_127_length_23612_cov_39.709863_10_plen_159_part_00